MKKLLGIALAVVSMGFVVSAEAKTADVSHNNTVAESSAAPQWGNRRYNNRRYNNRRRSVTRTRTVRIGRRLYRETYVVTYWPNGRTNTRLVSRQRVG